MPLAVVVSWQLPLAVFSAAAVAGAIWWLVLGPEAAPPVTPDESHTLRAAARRGEVWDIVAMFALMSLIYYGFVAWLPDAYVEHGWSEASAAAVMAVLTAAQIPGGMIVAALADRHRRTFVLGFAMLGLLGTAGLAAAPPAAWVWSALVGLSIGALFPLVLTLPLDLEDHPAGVAAVIGVVLGAGYSVAALAPTVLGGAARPERHLRGGALEPRGRSGPPARIQPQGPVENAGAGRAGTDMRRSRCLTRKCC